MDKMSMRLNITSNNLSTQKGADMLGSVGHVFYVCNYFSNELFEQWF